MLWKCKSYKKRDCYKNQYKTLIFNKNRIFNYIDVTYRKKSEKKDKGNDQLCSSFLLLVHNSMISCCFIIVDYVVHISTFFSFLKYHFYWRNTHNNYEQTWAFVKPMICMGFRATCYENSTGDTKTRVSMSFKHWLNFVHFNLIVYALSM
jgi:hypothetical protein